MSVSRSAGDQIEKYGSTAVSGTAGGRSAGIFGTCWA
jgi:hypothetical protein